MNNADMPASPMFDKYGGAGSVVCKEGYSHKAYGLTKREAFAMAALQGLASFEHISLELIASEAVSLADALLKELDKDSK